MYVPQAHSNQATDTALIVSGDSSLWRDIVIQKPRHISISQPHSESIHSDLQEVSIRFARNFGAGYFLPKKSTESGSSFEEKIRILDDPLRNV